MARRSRRLNLADDADIKPVNRRGRAGGRGPARGGAAGEADRLRWANPLVCLQLLMTSKASPEPRSRGPVALQHQPKSFLRPSMPARWRPAEFLEAARHPASASTTRSAALAHMHRNRTGMTRAEFHVA